MKQLIIVILFLFSLSNYAQEFNIKSYRWKYRTVLLISEGSENINYINQLHQFLNDSKGFEERKLKIIDIQPDKIREITYTKNQTIIGKWQKNSTLYHKYKSKKTKFKVLLIGLDGGIKKTVKGKGVSKELLFTLIDGMPMRRSELKKN